MFFLFILSISLFTTLAYADWKKSGILGGLKVNLPGPRLLLDNKDDLGLKADQEAQLKKLKFSSKKDKARKWADMEILRIELHELMDNKSVDKKAVEEKIDAIGNLYIKIIKISVNTKLSAREILTDDQFRKWNAIMKEKPARGGWGKERGRKR
jgi:Spy/CpxP family protein refolding chaperone